MSPFDEFERGMDKILERAWWKGFRVGVGIGAGIITVLKLLGVGHL